MERPHRSLRDSDPGSGALELAEAAAGRVAPLRPPQGTRGTPWVGLSVRMHLFRTRAGAARKSRAPAPGGECLSPPCPGLGARGEGGEKQLSRLVLVPASGVGRGQQIIFSPLPPHPGSQPQCRPPRSPPSRALPPGRRVYQRVLFRFGFRAEGLELCSPPKDANQVISPSQPHQIAL